MQTAIKYETKLKNQYMLESYLAENKYRVLLARDNSNRPVVIKALNYLVSDLKDREFLREQSLKDTPNEFYTGSTSLRDSITSDSLTLRVSKDSFSRSQKKATIEGLLKEYRIISKFNHPQIVRPIEKGDDYFVMEYHHGKEFNFKPSLKHFIKPNYFEGESESKIWNFLISKSNKEDHIKYSPEFKKYIRKFCSLLSTLDVVHKAGIVHKDIKSTNIVDTGSKIVLIDFDIAEDLNRPRIKTDYIQGTLQYLAPEEVWLEQADNRTDIFSMGMLLYRSLVPNAILFRSVSPLYEKRYLWEKTEREFISPRLEFPIISKELDEVVKKATRLDKEDRFNNTLEFKEALKKACFKLNYN